MIVKPNVSNELKSRLMHAMENGSVTAKNILLEIKKNVPVEEITRGTYNYFSTKRKWMEAGTLKKIRIVFMACSKDLAHPSLPDRNNSQAPWFPENRTVLEPFTSVELFKNLSKYSSDEINYFCSALSLDSKVAVRSHESMNDFMEVYLESNYSPTAGSGASGLHNSCVRYEDKACNAADLYTSFTGAKILVARDESNNILGRAVVRSEATLWKSISAPIAASLLDRIYFSHVFVAELTRKQAQEAGILLRRRYNDYTHTTDLTVLNPIKGEERAVGDNIQVSLTVKVPACRRHKKGMPYLDTFYSLHLTEGNLEPRNTEGDTSTASCRSMEGHANRRKYVYPKCGKIHPFPDMMFCKSCQNMSHISTVFGKVLEDMSVKYKGKKYPPFLFKKECPVPEFRRYLQIEELFISQKVSTTEKLTALYNISSPSGREGEIAGSIIGELRWMGIPFRQDRYGNIYAVKGNREGYPYVVAYMDEVHRRKIGSYAAHLVAGSMIVGYDHKCKRMTGTGADDKSDIWICLKCLEDFKVVKYASFVQEEAGCIGSGHADMSFFSNCRFVIQCDRKGSGDMTTQTNGMKLCSNDFISAIDFWRYGYRPAQGLATDAAALKKNGLEVSCANFPCGYHEPHTDNEYTILTDICKYYRFVRHTICCHKEASTHIPETERKPSPGYYELFGPAGYSEKDYIRLPKEYRSEFTRTSKTDHKSKL